MPPDATALVGYGAIFTLFFVTLGPLKIFGPFAQLTREADEATMPQDRGARVRDRPGRRPGRWFRRPRAGRELELNPLQG